jgi:hypothetical protein
MISGLAFEEGKDGLEFPKWWEECGVFGVVLSI